MDNPNRVEAIILNYLLHKDFARSKQVQQHLVYCGVKLSKPKFHQIMSQMKDKGWVAHTDKDIPVNGLTIRERIFFRKEGVMRDEPIEVPPPKDRSLVVFLLIIALTLGALVLTSCSSVDRRPEWMIVHNGQMLTVGKPVYVKNIPIGGFFHHGGHIFQKTVVTFDDGKAVNSVHADTGRMIPFGPHEAVWSLNKAYKVPSVRVDEASWAEEETDHLLQESQRRAQMYLQDGQ